MDDTTASRASDAAATRKRRSSILKSQRPARTPFSELEFHVATPTDTSKSRRVSFSRRTGVAEFATNEATTTWKNFYEEHNKSVESSGNDSGNTRQPLGHIAKGVFDQQFEEVEAVDFITTLHPAPNISTSINFEHRLAIEDTDLKITAPRNNFELSAFTNQTNLFGDELTSRGEVTDRIDVDFSALRNIDDLDEIQQDLQRAQYAHRSFNRQSMSEYIEVDLNMTHVASNAESDMSITESVHIPKVQVEPKNDNKDWAVDKENIAVNPYVAPRESENFAINEESDKVLVFDGKRLTVQSEAEPKIDYRQTLLPDAIDKAPQRKTIVLNVNDDLPNFLEDLHVSNNASSFVPAGLKKSMLVDDMSMSISQPMLRDALKQNTVLFDDNSCNMSITKGISNKPLNEKSRTILYENDTGNISVTKAIPSNIIANNEKRRTIVYNDDDGDLSITQAVTSNVLGDRRDRKTVFDENISMTQALPANIISNTDKNKRRTVVYEDDAGNVSITQAVPNILITEAKAEKRRTIVYEDETGNISITQAIPSNILVDSAPERRRTVVFESDTGNISVTQAVPSNLILQDLNTDRNVSCNRISVNQMPALIPSPEKSNQKQRRTIVYEYDTGNLSITQAVNNQMIAGISQIEEKANDDGKVRNTANNDRRTIVFDDDEADISMTEAIPLNRVIAVGNRQTIEDDASSNRDQIETDEVSNNAGDNKRKTIVFEADDGDISMTQAVPLNRVIDCFNEIRADVNANRRTVVFEEGDADISMTEAVNIKKPIQGTIQNIHDDLEDALNDALHKKRDKKSHRIIEFEVDNFENKGEAGNTKRKTIVFDDFNISVTQALPTNIFAEGKSSNESEMQKNTEVISLDDSMTDVDERKDQDVLSELGTGSEQSESILQNTQFMIPELEKDISQPIREEICDDIPVIEKEKLCKDIVKETKGVSEVFVYQATTAPSAQKILTDRTEQGDSKSQELADDEKISSSSKVVENVEAKTVESTTATEQEQRDINMNETESQQIIGSEDHSQATEMMCIKSKNSVLDDLLDMSSASTDGVDENLNAKDSLEIVESTVDIATSQNAPCTETNSKDTLFYITKDGEEEVPEVIEERPKLTEESPLPVQYKEPEIVEDTENKLEQIKVALKDDSPTNGHYEKILSSDLDANKKERKSFKTANDTNELLEMLSDLTDKPVQSVAKQPQLDPHLEEDEEKPEPITIEGHLALENKSESVPEPRQLSIATRRQSIVLSREDLLNNISMAGAVLKSRLEFDDSELEDSRNDTEHTTSPKKTVRMSREVVKTLQFDESVTEINIETKVTPLKKTAFGETAYMRENKTKVIPDFLTVSDGIKELMDDLVKPMVDVLPFDAAGVDRGVKKVASTRSTQIQANLVTSSQIDVNAGLSSRPDSYYDVDINKISSVDMINDAVNRSVSRALKSPIKSILTNASNKSIEMDVSETDIKTIIPRRAERSPGRVLIFDHGNPLNNVLLAPDNFTEAHKYNPSSTETICVSERSDSVQISLHEKETDERVSTQYNVGSVIHSVRQSGDGKIAESQSAVSNLSKPMSIDRSTDAKLSDVKDSEVNTVIAMKGNTELLEASSSLTLVDDALRTGAFDVDVDSKTTIPEEEAKSPVKVIFTVKEKDIPEKLDSDFTSNDDEEDRKPKKRIYSPTKREKHKHCTLSTLDLTPKPISKMQKLSDSPKFKIETESESGANDKKNKLKKQKKPGTSITVQQLMTEYDVDIDHESLDAQIKDILRDPKSGSSIEPSQTQSDECSSVEMVSSFTSSKNLRSDSVMSASSKVSRMDWREDVLEEPSCKPLAEGESGVNVVAKIDMMPFMGTPECEWESWCGDTWSFRLLHARLRLSVRLAHRHHNATRSRVRADTPVLALTLDTIPHENKNTVATVCVRFAAETMRYLMGRGCACAGDVPALVRRCAAAARLAARWGRLMRDAHARLAYTLTPHGDLSLKVANIPLRCVWEVTLRLELVVCDSREAPWVRAGGARVRLVVGDPPGPHAPHDAPPADVPARALAHLPRDWSHAPRTIWKIFKYLKNKTQEGDELFMGL